MKYITAGVLGISAVKNRTKSPPPQPPPTHRNFLKYHNFQVSKHSEEDFFLVVCFTPVRWQIADVLMNGMVPSCVLSASYRTADTFYKPNSFTFFIFN